MKFESLLATVASEPVFETGLLLAGDQDPIDVRRQLSRWVKAGRLYRLRRGLYALAPPFQKVKPHPFLVANHLQRGSYVSRQAALAYFGLIPEYVPLVTSVGPGRRERWDTPLGGFDVRHLRGDLLHGYQWIEVAQRQRAFVATPEKALLDLLYLEPKADAPGYLGELRLQNLETVRLERLRRLADEAAKPKLRRAVKHIGELIESESSTYEAL